MNIIPLLMLVLSQPAADPPEPLNESQRRDLSCVAVLAIIASEQERGMASAFDYPLLTERGATYAGLVGKRIMDETGRTKEQVREDILAALAAEQTLGKNAADPDEVVRREMTTCLPLLDAAVPPKPKPDLSQCAGMLQLAYEEVHDREGLSKTAQDLKTLAAVLKRTRRYGHSISHFRYAISRKRENFTAACLVVTKAAVTSTGLISACSGTRLLPIWTSIMITVS